MGKVKDDINTAFENYCAEYSRILESDFKPWANQKKYSIHETNLVVNFLYSYKNKVNEKSINWVELTIPLSNCEKKNNRIDGLIIDRENKRVFLIEAKRISRLKKKTKELSEDLKAIVALSNNKELKDRLGIENKPYELHCLLLADFWQSRLSKNVTEPICNIWDGKIAEYKADAEKYIEEEKLELKIDIVKADPQEQCKMIYCNNYHLAYALFKLIDF